MIERVRLIRYKGFYDFTVRLGAFSVLVGPNNAGKTTLAQSLRLCAGCLRHGRLRQSTGGFQDDVFHTDAPRWVQGHPLGSVASKELGWYQDENLRHEFREQSAGLEFSFINKARLRVVWPVDSEPFFYIEKSPGNVVRTAGAVKACTPSVGVVPTLSPVEHREKVLNSDYVRESVGTRLTSRHFRNQLSQLQFTNPPVFDDFVSYALRHTPELTSLVLRDAYGPSSHELDLFVTEASTHTEKEIFWLGDGLQVWLQVLLHTWANHPASCLVLDEPDVFLHPDLQRRLVGMLEELDAQVIVATHAPEILAEAGRDSIIWIDRTRRNGRRAREDRELSKITANLGSGFNLGLARALRSRTALFVEGQDMKILRSIARALGATRFSQERGLAAIPLGGFSNWHQVEPFAWLTRDMLGDAVSISVVLDRDYRSDDVIDALTQSMGQYDVRAHVWRRKELESYLLVPETISRVTGLPGDTTAQLLEDAIMAARLGAQSAFLGRRQRDAPKGTDPQTVVFKAIPEFDALWSDPSTRIGLPDPKDVIASVAGASQSLGGRAVSARAIASKMRASEVPHEMAELVANIEGELASGATQA